MKLIEYLDLFKGAVCIDTSDDEIDCIVTLGYDREKEEDKDFPFLDRFAKELFAKTDLLYLQDEGAPVADYGGLIMRNAALFRKFAQDEWDERLQSVIDDDSELRYEFIKEFNLILAGNASERINRSYYELLKNCK